MISWFRGLFGARPAVAATSPAAPPPFVAGQVWRYDHRPGEEGSTVHVIRVESEPRSGTVVHVSVHGLRLRNPMAPGGTSDRIGHMPFAEDALRRSVRDLVGERDADAAAQEGYDAWRGAFERGEAGVFTVTLAEAVGMMELALQ